DVGGSNVDEAYGLAIQPNGRIVVVGKAQIDANGNYDFAVARLTATGALDGTFANNNGKETVAFDNGGNNEDGATSVALQADGRIGLGGYAQETANGGYAFAAARLTTDGTLDNTFGSGGKQTVVFLGGDKRADAQAVAVGADGKIVLAGNSEGKQA